MGAKLGQLDFLMIANVSSTHLFHKRGGRTDADIFALLKAQLQTLQCIFSSYRSHKQLDYLHKFEMKEHIV